MAKTEFMPAIVAVPWSGHRTMVNDVLSPFLISTEALHIYGYDLLIQYPIHPL